MEVISVNEENIKDVINFLNELAVINDVNYEVVMNGEFVFEDKIIGLLSFEQFNKIGLIRYFIFKKVVPSALIFTLFNKIVEKAKRKTIDSLITMVVKNEAIEIFKELGFNNIEKEDVYIEEMNIMDSKFKDAVVLRYNIEK